MKKLNEEFVNLLKKHRNDDMITNKKALEVFKSEFSEEFDEEDFATIYNAFWELKTLYPERMKGMDWFFGSSDTIYENPWDVYVGKDFDVEVTCFETKTYNVFAEDEEDAKVMAFALAREELLQTFETTAVATIL